ncbi:hypothetical protein L1887_34800 [Cichorium endivia]|nr:hypothetical protein L1887_34800 [Cichorium endivia]
MVATVFVGCEFPKRGRLSPSVLYYSPFNRILRFSIYSVIREYHFSVFKNRQVSEWKWTLGSCSSGEYHGTPPKIV